RRRVVGQLSTLAEAEVLLDEHAHFVLRQPDRFVRARTRRVVLKRDSDGGEDRHHDDPDQGFEKWGHELSPCEGCEASEPSASSTSTPPVALGCTNATRWPPAPSRGCSSMSR